MSTITDIKKKIRSIPRTTDERVNYEWEVKPLVDHKIEGFHDELEAHQKFRMEQADKISAALEAMVGSLQQQSSSEGGLDLNKYQIFTKIIAAARSFNADVLTLLL